MNKYICRSITAIAGASLVGLAMWISKDPFWMLAFFVIGIIISDID